MYLRCFVGSKMPTAIWNARRVALLKSRDCSLRSQPAAVVPRVPADSLEHDRRDRSVATPGAMQATEGASLCGNRKGARMRAGLRRSGGTIDTANPSARCNLPDGNASKSSR